MGSRALLLWICHECKGHFRITHGDSFHRSGVACPLCGSRFVERQRNHQDGLRVAAKVLTGSKGPCKKLLAGEAVDPVNRPGGKRGSERAEVLAAHRAKRAAERREKLSQPGNYRLATLKAVHKQHLAAKAKSDRLRREADWAPL